MRELTDYAAVHGRLNGLAEPLPPEELVPPIVERFIAGDRAPHAAPVEKMTMPHIRADPVATRRDQRCRTMSAESWASMLLDRASIMLGAGPG